MLNSHMRKFCYKEMNTSKFVVNGLNTMSITKKLKTVRVKNPFYEAQVVDEEFLSKPPEYAYVSDSGRVLVSGIPVDLGDWIFIDVDIYGKTNFAVVCAETFNEYYEVVQP